ncbi:MAG: hypothetical protein HY271_20445 [Deltaproteobacteria bacterium]|nr:hypothetical protein [Deltaproteobacteria bacterium]
MSIRVRLLVSALAALFFVRPLLSHLAYQGGGGDILYFHFLWNAARMTWVEFHQIPLWNPYHCGGMVELANPHSMALSPLFIPALLFGADVGLRVFIISHFVIAFWGMWEWARSRGVPDRWAVAAGVPFAMGGFFAARSAGHISFLAFAWTPWIMLCLERARRSWAYAYLAGVLVALCVYEGSPYGTTFMIVLASMRQKN